MRKIIVKIHAWLSLPAGIIIVITCFTGAILVFQDEMLRLAYPSRYYVKEMKTEPIALDILIPIVNSQLDTTQVVGVKIFSDKERTYEMQLEHGFRVTTFVDPYTGNITGQYEFRKSFFFGVMSIHRWLMDGGRTVGKYVVGVCTLLFAVILITGIFIWAPRRKKQVKSGLRIKFKSTRRRLYYDLHRVLGIYASIILIICSLTGLMWSFEWYRNGVFKIFGAEAPQRGGGNRGNDKKESPAINTIHWQTVFNNLARENANYDYIRVNNGKATVHLKNASTSRASDNYTFNLTNGNMTEATLYKDQAATSRIWGWAYSLHVGDYWGIWSKILTCIASLVGASLPITGYYLYFKKHRRKRKS